MPQFQGLLGVGIILACCALLSTHRRAISWRLVVVGLVVQVILGLFVFKTQLGAEIIRGVTDGFNRVLGFSYGGSEFVFGEAGSREGGTIAFSMLPVIIYFSAIVAVLYHLGVMQVIVYGFARVLGALLRVSGAESMAAAANVFVGITEAPLAVKPYLAAMTRSELNALMCGGFATVAGSVLGVYLGFVGEEYGSFLIAASVMSAPAALVIAKILVPETEEPKTGAKLTLEFNRTAHNTLDALATGIRDGLFLALNIGAMLLVFYSLLALVNWPLQAWFSTSLEEIFGYFLRPLAWLLGAEWGREAEQLGSLLGVKICLNEWIAYGKLSELIEAGTLDPRTIKIATFALCGFANFGSIGVMLGGLGQLIPERRKDLSTLALRAMAGGALASFLTAAVAAVFV